MGRVGAASLTLAGVLAGPFAAAPAKAALAPNYERARELTAAITAAAPLLPTRPIDGVDYVAPDRIRIRAGTCTLDVEIVNVPRPGPPMPGPRRFEAKPGTPRCD